MYCELYSVNKSETLMKSETSTIKCKAIFSDDRRHRILLRHEWEKDGKSAMIIMICPNTADTLNVDLTTIDK